MVVVLAMLVFWIALRGEISTYGGFVSKVGTDTFSLHDLWTAIVGEANASTTGGLLGGAPLGGGLSPGVTGGGPGTPGTTANPGGGANTGSSSGFFSDFLKLFSGSATASPNASTGSGAAGPANPPTGAGY